MQPCVERRAGLCVHACASRAGASGTACRSVCHLCSQRQSEREDVRLQACASQTLTHVYVQPCKNKSTAGFQDVCWAGSVFLGQSSFEPGDCASAQVCTYSYSEPVHECCITNKTKRNGSCCPVLGSCLSWAHEWYLLIGWTGAGVFRKGLEEDTCALRWGPQAGPVHPGRGWRSGDPVVLPSFLLHWVGVEARMSRGVGGTPPIQINTSAW